MEVKQIVNQFKKTIVDYALPYDEIVIAPYSNGRVSGVTLFNGINVADYVTCEDQSAKLTSKQVAKELHVRYKRGIGF